MPVQNAVEQGRRTDTFGHIFIFSLAIVWMQRPSLKRLHRVRRFCLVVGVVPGGGGCRGEGIGEGGSCKRWRSQVLPQEAARNAVSADCCAIFLRILCL